MIIKNNDITAKRWDIPFGKIPCDIWDNTPVRWDDIPGDIWDISFKFDYSVE